MGVLIILVGLLELSLGIVTIAAAKSAIHEIESIAAFGFGSVTFALGVISIQLRSRH